MVDYSFIRLSTTLQKALTLGDSPVSTIFVSDIIQLLPNEVYLQITNTPEGIAFDGNYQVLVTDCEGLQLADITSNVAIEQFTDNNGLPQIKFELLNLGVDFYKRPVLLKFVHTVSNAFWYSNPICITSYRSNYTTRFDYRSYKDFYGTAYNIADCYQSIRLACFFDLPDAESSSEEYTQIDGNKVTSRLIQTDYHKFVFDKIDSFTYQRLNKLLTNSVIYVNGIRMTDKVVNNSGDRIGDTNWFSLDFKIAINYNEQFTPTTQIFEPLELLEKSPLGNYTLSGLPIEIIGTFNRNVNLNFGNVYLYKDNVLFQTYASDNDALAVIDNVLYINIEGIITENGAYYVNIDSGMFTDNLGNTIEITNTTDWAFEVLDGEFSSTDFDNTEFLTN